MSLVATRIQNMTVQSRLDKNEIRPGRYGALHAFAAQSEEPNGILTPELIAKAKASIGTTLQTPVINYDGGISIGNTRTVTIADSENTSAFVQIQFDTYAWGFTISPAVFMNNEISIQRDFEAKMMKYIYKLASMLDAAALAVLAADKTTVNNNPLVYTDTAGVITSTFAQRENFFSDLDVIMRANDFFAGLDIVGDAGVQSLHRYLMQMGRYNAKDAGIQFGDKRVFYSGSIVANPLKSAQGYAIDRGSLGMLTRFEREALLRTKTGDGHEWDIVRLPYLDMEVGSYFYDSVGNYSAIAGAATADWDRGRKEHYGFAVDVAFITAYNSDRTTMPSPIIAFDIDV